MAYDLEQVKTAYLTLTEMVKADLEIERSKGNIKGTEYADTYKALMNTCLKLAVEIPMKGEQTDLYKRQKEGFDDDLRRKMLDIQMNTWAMMFSSGLLSEKPGIIRDDEVSTLYNFMKDQVVVRDENTNN